MNEMRRLSVEIMTLKVTGATCGACVKAVAAAIAPSLGVLHPAQAAQRSAKNTEREKTIMMGGNIHHKRKLAEAGSVSPSRPGIVGCNSQFDLAASRG